MLVTELTDNNTLLKITLLNHTKSSIQKLVEWQHSIYTFVYRTGSMRSAWSFFLPFPSSVLSVYFPPSGINRIPRRALHTYNTSSGLGAQCTPASTRFFHTLELAVLQPLSYSGAICTPASFIIWSYLYSSLFHTLELSVLQPLSYSRAICTQASFILWNYLYSSF